jgi:hypothetical protein
MKLSEKAIKAMGRRYDRPPPRSFSDINVDENGKGQVGRYQSRYSYVDGPMYFLGQQIVNQMGKSGWPSFIHCCYRSPEKQQEVFDKGFSKARPFQSPHQFSEAVDIVHQKLFWNAPKSFWDDLEACTLVVSERFKVELTGGFDWGWDFAHIQLADWRKFAEGVRWKQPTKINLAARFCEVLPQQWMQHVKSKRFKGLA